MFAETVHWLRERGDEADYRCLLRYCTFLYGADAKGYLDDMLERYPAEFMVIPESTSNVNPRPRRIRLLWGRNDFSWVYGTGIVTTKGD